MDKNSASSIYCISDKSYRARQMLTYVFPWHIHDIDNFISNFLWNKKEVKSYDLL